MQCNIKGDYLKKINKSDTKIKEGIFILHVFIGNFHGPLSILELS